MRSNLKYMASPVPLGKQLLIYHVHAKGSKGASQSVAGYTRDAASVSTGESLEKAFFFSLDYLCWQLEEPVGPQAALRVGCGQAAAGCVLPFDAVMGCWIPPQTCKTSPGESCEGPIPLARDCGF